MTQSPEAVVGGKTQYYKGRTRKSERDQYKARVGGGVRGEEGAINCINIGKEKV